MSHEHSTEAISAARFNTTHWSVVQAAKDAGMPDAGAALENLCRTYWAPLYAYLRRHGSSPADAQDLVQGFFASLLERNGFAVVERERGKFRSFLLASLKHFTSNERERAVAQKRGGRYSFVPLDEAQAEENFLAVRDLPPDEIFARSWALAVIGQTIHLLREEYTGPERAAVFVTLEPFLSSERVTRPYAELAVQLGLSESGVKMAVQRMRRRFGELLRHEVARTVSSSQEVDEEIRALFAALRQ